MNEYLIDRIARDLETYLRMSCSTDWTSEDIARFLRMEYGALNKIENEFGRIGEALNDPISADFYSVATGVERLAIRAAELESCLAEVYSAASNGGVSDDMICMEEADRLLNGHEDE